VYPVYSAQLDFPDISQPADLAQLPLIQLDSSAWNCINWHDWFGHFGLTYTPPERVPMFNQVTLAFNAVLQGMGIGWAGNSWRAICCSRACSSGWGRLPLSAARWIFWSTRAMHH
jgi:DNA-binding transcriptional LysR family regulator